MRKLVEKYALDNAVKYGGKANPGSVVGSVIKENPDAKKDIAELKELAAEIIKEVNQLSLEEQEARLKELAPELLEEKEAEEKDLFSGIKVEGEVITAFPPEPSKHPHIGHAKSILVNYEFAKRNNGKFILRFEDTNPELAKDEFYGIHLNQYKWLGVQPDEVDYASDHMEEFYELAENLIRGGHAYVCTSPQEKISESRMSGEPCPERSSEVEDNLAKWEKMKKSVKEGGFDPGTAVLLAKIDLKHKNSVMRDPSLFRIIAAQHARAGSKYRAWPTYDFENSVMDGLEGVTHRFRTKEFEMRGELQRFLQKLLGLPLTRTFEFARFNLEGVESSGRKIRELIEKGEMIGWDDPSLTTLSALKRRGFHPEAIKDFVLSTGMTKSESTLTWDDLILHNRRQLDEEADRHSFIPDPVNIRIAGAPEQEVELNLHPEHRKGGRKFKTGEEFYLSREDYNPLREGKLYRLMECLNFTKKGDGFIFHSLDYGQFREKGDKIMNFLPVQENLVECTILMPDKRIVTGLAEPLVAGLKEGAVIQFERFGFCRLDDKKNMKFWYTHK